MPKTPRRQFLRNIVAAALAPAVISRAASVGAADEPTLIIDTHQHLWDLTKLKLPWLDHAPPVFRRNYRTEEYREATRGLNVKAVYMEVGVPVDQRPAEAEYVIDLCRAKTNPTMAAVIGGSPDAPGFAEFVTRFKASGYVRGVRQVLQSNGKAVAWLTDDFVRGIQFLGRQQLSFDLCMPAAELRDGLALSERCPDTRFILDHCGNADPIAFMHNPPSARRPEHDADAWKRDMEALAKRPNIICKISGIVARAPEKWAPEHLAPIVNHCLDVFCPDKVVFGGDWPICLGRAPLADWITALRQIISTRPAADQRKLWAENAKRLYALDV